MFRPKSMKKVRVLVLKSRVEDLIRELHEAGIVDIRKSKVEGLEDGRPLVSFDEISAELLRLRAVLTVMESAIGKKEASGLNSVEGRKALSDAREFKIDEKLKALNSRANELAERIKSLESEGVLVRKVMHFNFDFSGFTSRTLDYRVGEIPLSKTSRLREAIGRIKGHSTIIAEPGHNAMLVLFEKKNASAVESLLNEAGFNQLDLPEGMKTPAEALERIKNDAKSAKEQLKETRGRIEEISKANMRKVRELILSLEIMNERAGIASRFSSSRRLFVIEGWVVESDFEKVRKIVHEYGDAAELEDAGLSHDDNPPVVLDNPKAAGPFEFITKSYSLPNYFEIDPTMAYLIALPILYGMIVGDVVYGLISMGLAYFFLKKFEKSYIMSNVSKIWFYSAIPAIIFGVIFDEWGGMSHVHLLEILGKWTGAELIHEGEAFYHGFHRIENVLALIGLSALAGMIHLAAGFSIGAINEWHHNRRHSIAKIAWIGVEAGMLLALLPFLPGLLEGFPQLDTGLTTAGLVVLGISVVTLGATEGVIGIIEIPGLVGNILSYSRIAAIGIVGVVIAELLNEFIIPMPEQGLLVLLFAPIFVALHVMNAFIAMFESLIQGGRLNIVEFRSKFLHGGGDVFIPFALYSKKL